MGGSYSGDRVAVIATQLFSLVLFVGIFMIAFKEENLKKRIFLVVGGLLIVIILLAFADVASKI